MSPKARGTFAKGQSGRFHFRAIAARDDAVAEVARQAKVFKNGACREGRLRGVDAQ